MIYRDTSVLGAIFFRESNAAEVLPRIEAARWQGLAISAWTLTEIEPADFRAAAMLIEGPGNLRAGDALHLAVALRLRARLAALDRRLAGAATRRGIDLFPA